MWPRSEARAASAWADSPMRTLKPFVGALEVAQDVAGTRGQRLGRFDRSSNQPLVRRVERAGDLACAGSQLIGRFLGAGHQGVRRVVGAGNERARRVFGTRGDAAIRLLEGTGDILCPGEQGDRGLLGAFGDHAIGVGERRARLFMQRAGDFHDLFAQRAGDEDSAFLEHAADVVDTCRQRTFHGRGTLLDDAGLPAERLLDLFDIRGDCRGDVRASGGDLVDMTGQGTVDVRARIDQLAEIVLQRTGQHVSAFGQLADMAGNDVVDLAAARRKVSAGRLPARA